TRAALKPQLSGVVLHFVIATTAAAILTFLVRHAIVSGLVYGIAVYFFMNLVVIAAFSLSAQSLVRSVFAGYRLDCAQCSA
ncbi:MAG: hypothetical protein LC770_02020, partial [Acidobacteria bacterium]|nr:hypothetical protein [Acidobacteriota bacterium]